MNSAEWPQEIVVKPVEDIVIIPNNQSSFKPSDSLERKVRPQKDEAPNCPRCNSTNTKFCYYNNYSLSQPRYFCKACRRYWTAGGSLRNIPVGGGSRKNKRSITSSSTSHSSKKIAHDLVIITPHLDLSQNPNMKFQESQDLNLGFPFAQDFKTITDLIQVPKFDDPNNKKENIPSSSTNSSQLSALELLTGMTSSRGFNSFFPMQPIIPIGDDPRYSLPELKPSLNFTLDGLGSNGFGSLQSSMQESNGRLLFPFEDLNMKQGPNTTSATTENNVEENTDQNHAPESTGYWNGLLGGGTW